METLSERTLKDIQEFRNLALTVADLLEMNAREISLIIDISGDSSIINTYKLEVWTGKEWFEITKGDSMEEILVHMRNIIKYEKEKE